MLEQREEEGGFGVRWKKGMSHERGKERGMRGNYNKGT